MKYLITCLLLTSCGSQLSSQDTVALIRQSLETADAACRTLKLTPADPNTQLVCAYAEQVRKLLTNKE